MAYNALTLGTKKNPLRILVADNWGQDAHPKLKRKYPNITFNVWGDAPIVSDHPHGHMVAECLCSMLPKDVVVEVTFYPYLLLQQNSPDGWLDVIKHARDTGKEYHFANCSFGAPHNDSDINKMFFESQWRDGTKLKEAREKIGDTVIVFAAGNSDSSIRPFVVDPDNDINYPQKPLSSLPNVYVIGACDRSGYPSPFSSDGLEVFSMYWGERVPLYDPVTGRHTFVNGTSFASPFACGDMAALCLERKDYVSHEVYFNYVIDNALIAKGWVLGNRHPKAGYGCMLPTMAKRWAKGDFETLGDVPEDNAITYLDFKPLKKKKRFSIFGR